MMMGQSLKELGSTLKENQQVKNKESPEGEEEYDDDFQNSQQLQESVNENADFSQQQEIMMSGMEADQLGVSQQQEDEDVIDIDNPDELEAKGLKRIQIEGEEEEFLMDMEGNIYDLRGNFIGTTDGDGDPNAMDSQVMGEEEQFGEAEDF